MPQLNIPISLKKKEAGDPQSPRTPQSDEGRLQRSNSSVVGRTKQSPSRSNSFRDRLRLNRASEPDLTAAADAGEPDPSSPLSQRSSSFRDRFRRRSRKGDSESDLKAAADAGEPDASSPISDDQSENGAESPQRSWHDRLRSKGSSPRIRSQSSGSLRQKVVSMLGCEHDIDRERTNAPFNNRFGRLCVTWHSTELPPGTLPPPFCSKVTPKWNTFKPLRPNTVQAIKPRTQRKATSPRPIQGGEGHELVGTVLVTRTNRNCEGDEGRGAGAARAQLRVHT